MSDDPKGEMGVETAAAQLLGWREPHRWSLVPPIYPSASYERAADGTYPGEHTYGRDQNPTFDQVEALLAELEGGAGAKLFASGMAAATAILECLPPGAHVIAPDLMYWTIQLWLQKLQQQGRIQLQLVPTGDEVALAAALRADTALVWLETPSNPTAIVTDLAAMSKLARARAPQVHVVVDGTLPTPVLTRPLELGADLVLHSATKQLNGHSDVLAGAVITRSLDDPWWERIGFERGYRGAVLGPFEAWLLGRGLRTVFLRVHRSSDTALELARFLARHSQVAETLYPGLPEHPQRDLAAAQMQGRFGAMVSFRPVGGVDAARRVAGRLRLFRNATGIGGVESLVEHRAPIEGQGTRVPADLLRLSVGIEALDDLRRDLETALA